MPATRRKPLTLAERKAYFGHLRAGRAAATKKLWADAARSFEEALKVNPVDGVAHGEAGWAHFQAGDLVKARSSSLRAIETAAKPGSRAAAFYNLGRVSEAEGKLAEAAGYYRRSLLLRPHKGVSERLAGLNQPQPAHPLALTGAVSSCDGLSLEGSLCDCLIKWVVEDAKAKNEDVEVHGKLACKTDVFSSERARVAMVTDRKDEDTMDWRKDLFLLTKSEKGWSVAGLLAHAYTMQSGAGCIVREADAEVESFTVTKQADHPVLHIETRYTFNSYCPNVTLEDRTLTLCQMPPDGPVSCPFSGVVYRSLCEATDSQNMPVDGEPYVETPEDYGDCKPFVTRLDARLDGNGKLSVVQKEGKKEPWVVPLLGQHALW